MKERKLKEAYIAYDLNYAIWIQNMYSKENLAKVVNFLNEARAAKK